MARALRTSGHRRPLLSSTDQSLRSRRARMSAPIAGTSTVIAPGSPARRPPGARRSGRARPDLLLEALAHDPRLASDRCASAHVGGSRRRSGGSRRRGRCTWHRAECDQGQECRRRLRRRSAGLHLRGNSSAALVALGGGVPEASRRRWRRRRPYGFSRGGIGTGVIGNPCSLPLARCSYRLRTTPGMRRSASRPHAARACRRSPGNDRREESC